MLDRSMSVVFLRCTTEAILLLVIAGSTTMNSPANNLAKAARLRTPDDFVLSPYNGYMLQRRAF